MKDLKIVFLGTPDFVQVIKEALAKHFSTVDSLAKADLGVIAAYGHILTSAELTAPKYGCINVHPSLLPKYRGATPIPAAILAGDKVSGISIIKMDEEIDHGPVIYTRKIKLSDQDTFDSLSKKMFKEAAVVLPQIIKDFISGKVKPVEQDHSKATYCDKLAREIGYFPIENPPAPQILDRMIRAYYPWPGVWTRWSPSRHPEGAKRPKDLKIIKFLPGDLVQMEGKKAIPYKDFLNGYPDFPLKVQPIRLLFKPII